jgi:hemoglobin/transferrin/lactoferrin receptor protein
MRKNILIFIVLIIIAIGGYGQDLIIRDRISHQPLEMVAVYRLNPTLAVVTNLKGKADISAFQGADSIHIQLLGYESVVYSYDELKARQFKLYLDLVDFSLDEVVISATRWEQNKKDVPQKITMIKPGEVTLQNPQTAADMLSVSGEIFVQKSQLGGGSPMIRGFATNRVLIVVDGVRMNTAIFRSGNLQNVISLDPLVIEKTEVVFGPGSLIYGSDAIAGVMSFYTLMPSLSTGEEPLVKGTAFARWSSANMEKTGHLDLTIGLKKWAFATSATFTDYDDLKMGNNGLDDYLRPDYATNINGVDIMVINPDPLVQVPSGYQQVNFMQKIRYQTDNHWNVNYGFHFSTTADYSRYDRLLRYRNGKQRSAEWYYGPQEWMMNAVTVTHTDDKRLYDMVNITLAWQHFEESRHDRDFGDTELRHRTEKVNAFSGNLDMEKKLRENQQLYYGLEAVFDAVESVGEDENISTGDAQVGPARYPSPSSWGSFAGYVSYRYKPVTELTLQAGLRYNQVMLKGDFDTTFYPLPFTDFDINTGAVTGSTGLAWLPGKDWQVNLNLSTGFRAPNIDDVGKVFDSEPGSVVVPNPDLESEYAWNAELGVTKIFGNTLKFDVTGYYTYLDNAIVRRDYTLNGMDSIMYDGEMSKVQAMQNAAYAFVYGIQAGIEIKLPVGFKFLSKFNYQKGEEELDDGSMAPLRHAAPWFGTSHLLWKHERFTADFFAVYNGEVSNENLAPEEQSKDYMYAKDENGNPYSPSWYTLNIKAMYQVTSFLMVSAGLENITDQRYRPYSSGITAPGRNFIVSVKGTF